MKYVNVFLVLLLFAGMVFAAGCTKLTPDQKVKLDAVYKNLAQNSEKVIVESSDSNPQLLQDFTPQLLQDMRFQEICNTTGKGAGETKSQPVQYITINQYTVFKLSVTNFDCKSTIKNYAGAKDKDNLTAYLFYDKKTESIVCSIESIDTCHDASVNPGRPCPFHGGYPTDTAYNYSSNSSDSFFLTAFNCTSSDFVITPNTVHFSLINNLGRTLTDNITVDVGSWMTKENYGKPGSANPNIPFYSYCANATANYSAGILTVNLANCDLPIVDGVTFVPVTINYAFYDMASKDGIRRGAVQAELSARDGKLLNFN